MRPGLIYYPSSLEETQQFVARVADANNKLATPVAIAIRTGAINMAAHHLQAYTITSST